MRNKHHPDYYKQIERDLEQAESDLDRLIIRAQSVVPTIQRVVEDAPDWRKDVRQTLLENLVSAIESAMKHQRERATHESPPRPEKQSGANSLPH